MQKRCTGEDHGSAGDGESAVQYRSVVALQRSVENKALGSLRYLGKLTKLCLMKKVVPVGPHEIYVITIYAYQHVAIEWLEVFSNRPIVIGLGTGRVSIAVIKVVAVIRIVHREYCNPLTLLQFRRIKIYVLHPVCAVTTETR